MPQPAFDAIGGGGPQVFGLPVDRDLMFSNHKGIFKSRIEKRQRKLIVKLAFLKPFLRPAEKIILVTTCYSPLRSLGQYLTGFVFIYLKRSLLVFTNFRVIQVPTTPSYKYRQTLAQIEYSGCRNFELRRGALSVEYAKFNKIERFRNIGVSQRRKLRALLNTHINADGLKEAASERNHLCPRCTRVLPQGKFKCEHCELKFKSKLLANLMAVLVPGGGYLYTRRYLIGLLCAGVEIFLLIYFAVSLQDTLVGLSDSLLFAVVMGAIYLVIKIISIIHSTESVCEYIPATTRFEVQPQRLA